MREKPGIRKDDILIVDRTSRKPKSKPGNHIDSIDTADFKRLIKESMSVDFDVTLEIEDKEKDALKAVKSLLNDGRFEGKKTLFKRQMHDEEKSNNRQR